jgi:hypothetical protein
LIFADNAGFKAWQAYFFETDLLFALLREFCGHGKIRRDGNAQKLFGKNPENLFEKSCIF